MHERNTRDNLEICMMSDLHVKHARIRALARKKSDVSFVYILIIRSVYFGEFNNSGPGANMSGRVPYARSLSFEEALGCTQIDWIDGSEWVDDR